MTKHAALTDRTIRAVKRDTINPRTGKPLGQLTDGRGLYLKLQWDRPAHSWRFDFKRPDGQRDTMVLGSYEHTGTPSMPLALARERAAELRAILAQGIDPRHQQEQARQAVKAAQEAHERKRKGLTPLGSFKHVAELLLEHKARINAWGVSYTERFTRDLKLRVYPKVGDRAIAELEQSDFLAMAEGLLNDGDHDGAKRALHACEAVLGFGVLKQFCKVNHVSAMGKLSLVIGLNPKKTRHHAAQLTPEGVARVMRLLDANPYETMRNAVWVAAQTFQRPRNVSAMRWADVDLDAARWVIPSELMKRNAKHKREGAPHVVPLARQTVALLRAQLAAHPGSAYVFPHRYEDGKPMARNAMNECFHRLGIGNAEHTPHGFRAMARTMGEERLHIRPAVLEAHLAHIKGNLEANGLGAAYARATHLAEREVMVQQWADYLDHIVRGVPLAPLQAVPMQVPVQAVPLARAA